MSIWFQDYLKLAVQGTEAVSDVQSTASTARRIDILR